MIYLDKEEEKIQEKRRQWRINSRRYRKKHPDMVKKSHKKYVSKIGGYKEMYLRWGRKRNGRVIGKHITLLTGERNPNWKGGKSLEIYPTEWKKTLKESIRIRDNRTCCICGIKETELSGKKKKLSVHHIDYNKKNCNPNNLISLCGKCHGKTNYKRNYWINYFKNYEYNI